MNIKGPLIPAKFVSRPNRFITIVSIDGNHVESHLADPGRLKEILLSGADLMVRPVPRDSVRKTKYSTIMAKHNGQWVSLVSALPNQFIKDSLLNRDIPFLNKYSYVRSEIPIKRHRFDFLLKTPEGLPFYLEVKSVTFVENDVAQFPDAITKRGKDHANTLSQMIHDTPSVEAGILFVCQRPDAKEFRPMWNRDPLFSQALLDAHKNGVKVWCITTTITKTHMQYYREIPLNLAPL